MDLTIKALLMNSFYFVLIGALVFSTLSRHYSTRDRKKAKGYSILSIIFSVAAILSLVLQ